MKQKYEDFVSRIKDMDLTDYQTEIVEEYIKIGDHPLYGGKHCGSDAEKAGAEYIAEKMKELGLDSVELIPIKSDRFQFNDALLTSADGNIRIRPYATTTIGTDAQGINAAVVDAGVGLGEDFDKADVRDKIVLIVNQLDIDNTCPLINESINEAARRGAAAVIISNVGEFLEEDTITAMPHYRKIDIPIVSVSKADVKKIRAYDGMWNLKVDAEFKPGGGTTHAVVGEIKGRSTDQRIVYTGHLDQYFKCIQDNVSSVVSILAIARMMKDTGYVPEHTITFITCGAHEIGNVNSATGDFRGIYGLMHEERPDILESCIADINFEYTALAEHDLRALPSHALASSYLEFASGMPEKLPGFDKAARDVRHEDFYASAWCDAAVFTMSGIPAFVNDCMSDQIYTMDSPYMGRDHSQKDNWDIYDRDALRSNTFWYAALGAYLDNTPLTEYDFAGWIDAIDFEDEEKEFAAAAELDLTDFEEALDAVRAKGSELRAAVKEYNRTHEVSEESAQLNAKLLDIHKHISARVDQVNSQIIKIFAPLYKLYGWNLALIAEALELMENGSIEEARAKLLEVDITAVSYFFGKQAGDEIRVFVDGANETWTKGKGGECFDLSEIITREPEEMAELLYAEMEKMTMLLMQDMSGVAECLTEAVGMMDEFIAGITA